MMFQPGRDCFQDGVAGGVAKLVVEWFEAIEVDKGERQGRVFLSGPFQRLDEGPAIEEPGQRIGGREPVFLNNNSNQPLIRLVPGDLDQSQQHDKKRAETGHRGGQDLLLEQCFGAEGDDFDIKRRHQPDHYAVQGREGKLEAVVEADGDEDRDEDRIEQRIDCDIAHPELGIGKGPIGEEEESQPAIQDEACLVIAVRRERDRRQDDGISPCFHVGFCIDAAGNDRHEKRRADEKKPHQTHAQRDPAEALMQLRQARYAFGAFPVHPLFMA